MKDMVCTDVNSTDTILNTGFFLWLSDITIYVIKKTQGSHHLQFVLDSHERETPR